MKWRIAIALLIFAGSSHAAGTDPLPTAKPEDVGLSSVRLERIAQVLRGEIDHGRMPGAVIAISRKGKLAYYESFGFLDKAAGTPMPKDAIFALASMTKPMAAVAALMLVETNDLLLNDPIGNYLPGAQGHEGRDRDRHGTGASSADAAGHDASHRGRDLRQPGHHRVAQAISQRQRLGHDEWTAVPGDARQAAASLPARHDVGLQLRSRGHGAGGRGGDEAAAGRLSAVAPLRAARDGGHAIRRARRRRRRASPGRFRSIPRPASRPRSVCRSSHGSSTAAVAARRERRWTTRGLR